MRVPTSLPGLLGYEDALVATLPEARRRTLSRLAEAWLLSCFLLALPVGYAVWLVEHAFVGALFATGATFLLVLNLLRLGVAGGGASSSLRDAELAQYRPALGQSVVLIVLAALLAQPAQLAVVQRELDALVHDHRDALVREHSQRLERLGLPDDGGYARELEACEFVVYRLNAAWNAPGRALRYTGLYVLFVLVPALWARFFALDTVRAYELARLRARRKQVEQIERKGEREVERLLRAHGVQRRSFTLRRPFVPGARGAESPQAKRSARGATP